MLYRNEEHCDVSCSCENSNLWSSSILCPHNTDRPKRSPGVFARYGNRFLRDSEQRTVGFDTWDEGTSTPSPLCELFDVPLDLKLRGNARFPSGCHQKRDTYEWLS